jgi:hypothetical protein
VPCSEFRASQQLEMRTPEDALREAELMTTASPVTLSKLVSRHEVAERTTAFRFEKPSNWTFKAMRTGFRPSLPRDSGPPS